MSGKHRKHKGLKIFLIIFLILVILVGLVGFIGYNKYNEYLEPMDLEDKEPIVVEIPKGSSGYKIIDILVENGLARDSIMSKVFLKLNKFDKLQANAYVFDKSMSLIDMFNVINTGDFDYIYKSFLTIIDGSTVPQAAEQIEKALGLKKDEILRKWSDFDYLKTYIDQYEWLTDDILKKGILYPLEGYLYPETYTITGEVSIENVTKIILKYTDKMLSPLLDDIKKTDYSVHEFITYASIVESEAYTVEEKPMLCGVLNNRFKSGMPLQCDSTVLYGLQSKHIDITTAETQKDTPYSTYKYKGLPIGPICNPNITSFNAVLNPETHDYYYFFHTKDHSVLFAKTYSEHLKNIKENKWY